MKTRMPFSTISFNTPEFLEQKLSELRNAGKLSEWFFITHKPEDDESGGKEHSHVFFIPSKSIQTDDVRNELKEYDPTNPTKPRGTLLMRQSKFGSWYLYSIHDPEYLASKCETRRYHYRFEDFVTSDPDVFYEMHYEIDVVGELGAFKGMAEAKKRGLTFQQFFNQGKVHPAQVSAYSKAWEYIDVNITNRGSHVAHSIRTDTGEILDPNTGEISDDPIEAPWKPLQNALKAAEDVGQFEYLPDCVPPFDN